MSKNDKAQREQAAPTFNSFTTLFYGAIVNQILDDVQDPVEATNILDKLGRYMGCKMVDDYLAWYLINNPNELKCSQFSSSSKGVIGGLAYFLYARATLVKESESAYSIKLLDNPLEIGVRKPYQLQGLVYSQVIGGAIAGALGQLGWVVTCNITSQDNYWLIDCCKTSDVVEIFK